VLTLAQELAKCCGLKDIDIVERGPASVPLWTLKLPITDISLSKTLMKSDLPLHAKSETNLYYENYSGHLHIYTDVYKKNQTLAMYLQP
jgi:hypothetical protein